MKRDHLCATAFKKIVKNACFASFLLMASFTGASAQKATDSTAAGVASVSYIGYNNDQLSFLMKYENETGGKYSVTITDGEGNILYNESFTAKKLSKVFKTHVETSSLTFVISNPKKKEEKKFQVNNQRHMVEEFSITKAN
jgi:hypothetical protein